MTKVPTSRCSHLHSTPVRPLRPYKRSTGGTKENAPYTASGASPCSSTPPARYYTHSSGIPRRTPVILNSFITMHTVPVRAAGVRLCHTAPHHASLYRPFPAMPLYTSFGLQYTSLDVASFFFKVRYSCSSVRIVVPCV